MLRRVTLAAALLSFVVLASACSASKGAQTKAVALVSSSTSDAKVGSRVLMPATPEPPMLSRPESAVYSYMLWISHAYIRRDSALASATFDPYEEVRVNSYIQLNTEKGQVIQQQPKEFEVKSVKTTDGTATVVAKEAWRYRYINAKTGTYSTPVYTALYDSTYTLVHLDRGWVVHEVDATARGDLK